MRDLGLPRDAVVNVIVRGDQAIPPRGSTRLRAGDRVHVLVRSEVARQMPALLDRWAHGPVGPPPRPPRPPKGARRDLPLVALVRRRRRRLSVPTPSAGIPSSRSCACARDEPGGLWVLADGRYAVSGTIAAIGGRDDVTQWARRRLRQADPDERAWLQTVVGALAADLPSEAAEARGYV